MQKPYIYQDHLETQRLYTRFLTPEDIPTWSEFFKDEEATMFFPDFGLASDEDRAKYWIEKQQTRYSENLFGLQALFNKKTHEFIGQCGLLSQQVDREPEVEVGYHVFKKYWGKGYAPEAARLFIDYVFTNNLTGSVISIIDIGNVNSQRVAEKNGLKREKRTNWGGLEAWIYRIKREEWL